MTLDLESCLDAMNCKVFRQFFWSMTLLTCIILFRLVRLRIFRQWIITLMDISILESVMILMSHESLEVG